MSVARVLLWRLDLAPPGVYDFNDTSYRTNIEGGLIAAATICRRPLKTTTML